MTLALGVLIALAALFVVVVSAVAKSLLTEEARAWLPYLSQRLIRSAARRLPDEERERYEEDWLAELAAWDDRPVSAFARAAHIRWKTREMRAALGAIGLRGMRIKRAMDLLVASATVALLLPMLTLLAVLIKTASPGPVLVRSLRVGRDGKRFAMLKFNSRGRYGVILRRTSLDELPQLVNVLRGEMSLVGPRPLVDRGAELDAPPQVRPGLVSPAGVNAQPIASYEELKRLDREYERTRSFARDLKLLALGVVAVLRRRPPL